MRWLTNFYDFRFKWTATPGIGIHHTKAWLSQLVNFKKAIWTLEDWYAIKFCDESWIYCYDRETKRQSSQWKHAALPDPRRPNRSWPFFWQHWHDLHALGSHWKDSQQGILYWGFKGVQVKIPSEEASTLQIRSVAFPQGQYTSPQFYPCHRLFDQDGHQDSSSASLWLLVIP